MIKMPNYYIIFTNYWNGSKTEDWDKNEIKALFIFSNHLLLVYYQIFKFHKVLLIKCLSVYH
jgi:hypothetical protein